MPNNAIAARAVLDRMNLREVAVAHHYTGLPADLHFLATADIIEQQELLLQRRGELCAAYGQPIHQPDKPFAFANGIAFIPVHGTLINRFGSSWGCVTGYNFIRHQTALAGMDDDVKHIVYDHNSYGGEAAGCFECAGELKKLANGKPTLAVVDSNCYSASYAIACGADQIAVTPSGGVGSVGVVAMHMDMSKMLDDFGLKITLIHAGDHKVDGNPFEALPKEVRADIQKGVDKSYATFVAHVAEGRLMDEKKVRDTEARIYRADEALQMGLIDFVATPSEAVLAFVGGPSGSTVDPPLKETPMAATDPVKPDAAAQAATEARTAERTRVSGIINCEEAKDRTALANHLAMNTDLSVEQAQAILKAAPVATVATVPAAEPAATKNVFKEHMNADKHPAVGADNGPGGSGDAPEPPHIAIIRAQELVTGRKLLSAS
jgi:signal peptide peptidase SppA